MRARRSPPRSLVLAALLSFLGWAPAHTGLRRSEPAKDSKLEAAPTRVWLWFTARPQTALSAIRLIGPAGDVPLDEVVADTGNSLRAEIRGATPNGAYRVEWRTAGADGHPIRGQFNFTLIAPAAAAPDTMLPVVATPMDPGMAMSTEPHKENRTARWLEFVALLTVLGVLGFRHGVLPPLASRGVPTADASDRAGRLGQSALGLYLLAVLVRLYGEVGAVFGPSRALDPTAIGTILSGSTWGIGWLLGVIGAAFTFAGWRIFRRSVAIGTPLALTGAFGMVMSPALSGHAASSKYFIVSVTLDLVHIAAGGAWLGALLIVVIAGIPAMRRLTDGNRDAAVSALVNSFHPLALFAAPLVVVAGLGTVWVRSAGVSNFWSTDYARVFLIKVGLFLIVAGMGMYNALRARRRLGTAEGTAHLRLTSSLELFFAALVVAATTILVSTPTPH